MKKITLLEIKQALWDHRFREMFPEYENEIKEFINNPGCACNVNLYRKILKHKDVLKKYFPTREIETPQEEIEKLSKNSWIVINCHVDELQERLKKLGTGRKQVAVGRYQDQVTVVVNELEILL